MAVSNTDHIIDSLQMDTDFTKSSKRTPFDPIQRVEEALAVQRTALQKARGKHKRRAIQNHIRKLERCLKRRKEQKILDLINPPKPVVDPAEARRKAKDINFAMNYGHSVIKSPALGAQIITTV